ncbi:MAG: hypothetical protein JST83_18410 [Bacteroidetes bacterium]|nr:hypothetical protein [Bacteroidota bacterium]
MIYVKKPVNVPKHLTKRRKKGLKVLMAALKANPLADLKFDSDIYGDAAVKKVLKKAQKNKCCFCEKKQVDEYGQVEHFRPKGGYLEIVPRDTKEKLSKPGYYWLAYDWQNLFFVCGPCNLNKGNLFPLNDPKQRAKKNSPLTSEKPLIIDPGINFDFQTHFTFDESGHIYGQTVYGKNTVEACQLNRETLREERACFVKDLKRNVSIAKEGYPRNSRKTVREAIKYLKDAQDKSSKFSALAVFYIKNSKIQII